MKKIFSAKNLFAVFVGFLSAILVPMSTKSQDLTEAQIKARCQTNKNKLEELEKQLKAITEELGKLWSAAEIKKAEDKMIFVRRFKNKQLPTGEDLNQFNRIAREFKNSKLTAEEIKQLFYSNLAADLEKIIGDKIDAAKKSANRRVELANQKTELDKQINTHRSNIAIYGCDKSTAIGKNVWEGDWVFSVPDDPGLIMKMSLKGSGVLMEGTMNFKSEEVITKYTIRECDNTGENKMQCRFTMEIEDYEKLVTSNGNVSLTNHGKSITSTWTELAPPKVKWKPGYQKDIIQTRGANKTTISFDRK